jgi:mRNA-degrading endonuclease RelE of RelBE toxin-antitoxin system
MPNSAPKSSENVHVRFLLPQELDGLLRWRTGDYRRVYKIDEEKRLVVLLDVGPRKAIYD